MTADASAKLARIHPFLGKAIVPGAPKAVLRALAAQASVSQLRGLVRRDTVSRQNARKMFIVAADLGRVSVMEWLDDEFGLSGDVGVEALNHAASRNHPDAVQWLVNRAGLTRKKVSDRAVLRLFVDACGRGQTELARTLADEFALTSAEGQTNSNIALRRAAGNGHLETVMWLVRHFDITKKSLGAMDALADAADCCPDVARNLSRALGVR